MPGPKFHLALRTSISQILLGLGKSWFTCNYFLLSENGKLLALQENLLVPND